MSSVESAQRFFRPSDVARLRRNQRRIQLQRGLLIARNVAFVVGLLLGTFWIYRQTHSDARFAVRRIETTGAAHVSGSQIDAITRKYLGANLFRLDIAGLQRDLGTLSWIERIEIEKKLPDTLRIKIVERVPAALLQLGNGLQYVDGNGVVLSEVSPKVGDDDLPLIAGAGGEELARTVRFLASLRKADPALYSRVAEIRPLPPRGFAVYDRELGATVYANENDAVAQWRNLYAVARAEQFGGAAVEYADLRFADRIVLKPRAGAVARAVAALPVHAPIATEITN